MNMNQKTVFQSLSFYEEEVSYQNNRAHITLAGTLTLPKTSQKSPVVLLIPGYGPSDRDMTGFGHKYFQVLAYHLAQQGIASLRVDKRGVGKSTGDYTSATSKDFADDVLTGIEYLKICAAVNSKQIGLIGFSEGGMIASMVASQSKDVSFLVLMAGFMLTKIEDFIEQASLQLQADGASQTLINHDAKLRKQILTIVKNETDLEKAEAQLHTLTDDYWQQLSEELKTEAEKFHFAFKKSSAAGLVKTYNSPAYRFFLNYNPIDTLKKITIPVLALNGDKDWIVPSKKSLPAIAHALEQAGNKDYTTLELPNLNHRLQACQTGALVEYMTIKEALDPSVLTLISNWILKRIKNI